MKGSGNIMPEMLKLKWFGTEIFGLEECCLKKVANLRPKLPIKEIKCLPNI
jgi:hypothetical protein